MQLKQDSAAIRNSYKSLHALIRIAIAKATNLERSILLSYSFSWQYVDPLLFLAAKAKSTEHKFYWEQPQQNLTLVAAGAVAEMPAIAQSINTNNFAAQNRFNLAKQFAQDHLLHAVVGNETGWEQSSYEVSPYILGGFSFYDIDDLHLPAQRTWHGCPNVIQFIPLWLMRQIQKPSGKVCTMTINQCVQPWESLETVEKNVIDLIAYLQLELPKITKIGSSANLLATIKQPHSETGDRQNSLQIHEVHSDQPWTEMVQQAINLIQLGKLDKVVLARALDVIAEQAFNPAMVLQILRLNYPECISFLFDYGLGVTFLGATPELLLKFQGCGEHLKLQSEAVAGSTPRGKTEVQDNLIGDRLLASLKDLNEHKIVVKSICDRLQNMGAELIGDLEPPRLLKLSNVQHLYTPITAILPNTNWLSAFDVLAQLHPTAAVGGEPREQAIKFMQEWESSDRGWYAAPVGWVNGNGEGAFAVGIRSGYIQGNVARVYAGAGIVADSLPADELKETTIKFEALLRALRHASEWDS